MPVLDTYTTAGGAKIYRGLDGDSGNPFDAMGEDVEFTQEVIGVETGRVPPTCHA